MAIAAYTKTTYVNDTTPAINATNLNNIEQQVKDISDAIGAQAPTLSSFNAVIPTLKYRYATGTTGAPDAGAGGNVDVIQGANYDTFYAADGNNNTWFALRATGSGALTWYKAWTSSNDGNGGQQPAPKPKDTASSEIGAVYSFSAGDGVSVALPSGGKWVLLSAYYVRIADTLLLNALVVGSNQSILKAGGTTIVTGVSGFYGVVHAWRSE